MSEYEEYPTHFEDEPEDNGIEPEVGIKKLKEDLERKKREASDAEQSARDSERKANAAQAELMEDRKRQFEAEKNRAKNSIEYGKMALKKALDDGDNDLVTQLTADMVAENVRLQQMSYTNIQPQEPQRDEVIGYKELLTSKVITAKQREFLSERPELEDPENFRIMMDAVHKVNSSGLYAVDSRGWMKEIDRRLELNGVYEQQGATEREESVTRDNDRNSRQEPRGYTKEDKNEYRERYGSPSDSSPPSIPRGGGRAPSGEYRRGPGVVRLSAEERDIVKNTGNWTEDKYIQGKKYLDYAKTRGEYEESPSGRITIKLGSAFQDFKSTQRR